MAESSRVTKGKKLNQKMQLDTLSSMHSAIGLYKSLGFVVTTPYYDNPHPDVVFYEKILDGQVNS